MLKGVFLAFLSYAFYTLSDASIKLLEGTIDPYEVVFFGTLFGFLAVPFVKRPEDRIRDLMIANHPWLWALRSAVQTGGAISAVVAFTVLPMAEAFALIFLLPTFVTILSVIFLKEPVGWRRWSAVAGGFAGVLIVLQPGFKELSHGHLAAVLAGLSGAVTIVIYRLIGTTEKPIAMYGSSLIGPALVTGLAMMPGFTVPTAEQWAFLLGYGVLGACASITLMKATKLAPASAVAPPQYSQMIWAVAIGYYVFGDTVDLPMIVGICVIIGAGLVTLIREKKKQFPAAHASMLVNAENDQPEPESKPATVCA